MLKPGGICTIATYVGHEEGAREYAILQRDLAEFPTEKWVVVESALVNRPAAPRLVLLYKRC